eukprot:CAMPEP_0181303682 /NCGR_PEP_ID=MMETSP1101-20121128/8700_1 /TAXON_ID=46948 /ORGANISM="Rhodomonas abbreviata, Strain Caron Lab Isolate" /LENGTH=496 /DNA_ID=CAMNT_0023409295 /DNA_START=218 /DNA_END=1708 /DNA_ORIENTATION=-
MTFEQAVFEGLAPDGGLLVPHFIPDVRKNEEWKKWKDLKFHELAYEIASKFVGDEIPQADLKKLMKKSYEKFTHDEVVPTRTVGDVEIMELFHGPTFAFKDVALQALGNLFEYFLLRNNKRITVVGATSGDTGSAAISGLSGKKNVECFILFPEGRVSPIQQLQMTSVLDDNVHCIAVQGTFDDCQSIVKNLFCDLNFKKTYSLGAVNSINFARIMFQITYYFYTYYKKFPNCDGTMSFSVPTGNYGDILAGYYAKKMGLPVQHLIVATNENDILNRFFLDGKYSQLTVMQTSSPSMDIGISSNFERYLFYLFGNNNTKLAQQMATFNQSGVLEVDEATLKRAKNDFLAAKCTEAQCKETIAKYHKDHNYMLDPHTACGVNAVQQLKHKMVPACNAASGAKHSMVVLATAHPAKFSSAVVAACGVEADMPAGLRDLRDKPVRFTVLAPKAPTIKEYIKSTVPDPTGSRNVYTTKHYLFLASLSAASALVGMLLAKK